MVTFAIFQRVYKFLIICCCLLHLYFELSSYFAYETVIKSGRFYPSVLKVPRTSICFNYGSLLGNEDRHWYFEESLTPKVVHQMANLTVMQVFNATPKIDQVIHSCAYRTTVLSGLMSQNKSFCDEYFNVTKFLVHGHLCYMLTPKVYGQEYDFGLVSSDATDRRVLYRLSIKSPLDEGHKLLPIIHFGKYPLASAEFFIDLLPSGKSNELYTLTYESFETFSLPSPYATACQFAKKLPACYFNCLNDFLRRRGVALTLGHIFEPVNRTLVHLDIPSKKIKGYYMNVHHCISKCRVRPCRTHLLLTSYSSPQPSIDKLTFSIEAPATFVTLTQHMAKLSLYDLINALMTLTAIWLGVSIYPSLTCHSQSKRGDSSDSCDSKPTLDTLNCTFRDVHRNHRQLRNSLIHKKTLNASKCRSSDHSSLISICYSLFRLCIFITLAVEVTLIVKEYMLYRTLMNVNVKVGNESHYENYQPPYFAICTPFGSHVIAKSHRESSQITRTFSSTIADIFNRTLSPSSLFRGCRLRRTVNSPLVYYEGGDCIKKLQFVKFYMDLSICYRIMPHRKFRSGQFQAYHQIFHSPGIIYTLVINTTLFRSYSYWLLLFNEKFPYYSREFPAIINHPSSKSALYLVTYSPQSYKLLPAPFETNCYKPYTSYTCKSKCILESTINKLGHHPYTEIAIEPVQLKISADQTIRNSTFSQIWSHILNFCYKLCKFSPCSKNVTETYVSHNFDSQVHLEFAVHTPIYPKVESAAEPVFPWNELIIRLASCFSFWLGISALTLDLRHTRTWLKDQLFKIKFGGKLKDFERKVFRLHKESMKCLKILKKSLRRPAEVEKLLGPFKVKKLLLLSRVFCAAASFIGFVLHLYFQISVYMQYPTNLNTMVLVDHDFHPKMLSVCFNVDQIDKPFGVNATVESLFKYAPMSEDLLSSCGYIGIEESRGNSTRFFKERYQRKYLTLYECMRALKMKRFLLNDHICFTYKHKKKLKIRNTNELFTFKRQLLVVKLANTFKTRDFVVSISETCPKESFVFSPNAISSSKGSSSHFLSYIKIRQTVEPYPYDKSNYLVNDYHECVNNCIEKSLVGTNFASSHSAIMESTTDNRLYGYKKAHAESYHRIRRKCLAKCLASQAPLNLRYATYSTTILYSTRTRHGKAITFYVFHTQHPLIEITYSRKYTTYELWANLFGIIELWFGLSVLKLNPFLYLKRGVNCFKLSVAERLDRVNSMLEDVGRANQMLNSLFLFKRRTGYSV